MERLDARERAFAHELTYGVTRLRGRLDHLLSAHVHRGLESLDSNVHELLRMGVYQLLYMGGVPDYAAVSETVDQVREAVGPKPAGFVNAVLRRVRESGDGPERFPAEADDPATFLATWGSHPRWLVERWLLRWSVSEVRALVESNNRRPALNLCALEIDPDEAVHVLAESGIDSERVGAGSASVRLAEGTSPSAARVTLTRTTAPTLSRSRSTSTSSPIIICTDEMTIPRLLTRVISPRISKNFGPSSAAPPSPPEPVLSGRISMGLWVGDTSG